MSEKKLNVLGPIISILFEDFSLTEIRKIVAMGGIVISLPLDERVTKLFGPQRGVLMSLIQKNYENLSTIEKDKFLKIIVCEIVKRGEEYKQKLENSIKQIGWLLLNGQLVQVEILDESDISNLPEGAHSDMIKAAHRMFLGDFSGAIAAACGAVDSITNEIYHKHNLGNPEKASFQEKVNNSLRFILKSLINELTNLGWSEKDARNLFASLSKSLNKAAYVMQSLRSKMGDVHGTKPILKPLVFDTINWAKIILSLLKAYEK